MRMRAANTERQLANELSRVRDRLAEVRSGTGGDSSTRPAATRVSALIEQLQRMGDTAGTQDVARLIDVESDLAEPARFERQYQIATERLSLRVKPRCKPRRASSPNPRCGRRCWGAGPRRQGEVRRTDPQNGASRAPTGSEEAVNRVARPKIEIASLKTVTDEVAVRISR